MDEATIWQGFPPSASLRNDERKGDYTQTFIGGKFWPLDPRADEVHIEDIAHALSNICRYNGMTSRFYSVAEHSILVAQHVASQGAMGWLVLRALLHDAAEAYLCDIVRPVKRHIVGYEVLECDVERVIWDRFVLPDGPCPSVKEADDLILYDEANTLMRVDLDPWHEQFAPGIGAHIVGMRSDDAERAFLRMFHTYGGFAR